MKQVLLRYSLVLVFILSAGCTGHAPQSPSAVNGLLDLGAWDFKQNGRLNLDGEWTVYRNRLLTPAELLDARRPEPDGVITVPGYWTGSDSHGYHTYALRILLKPGNSALLAIRLGDVVTAYRLWINGDLAAEVGTVGMSVQQERAPDSVPGIIPVHAAGNCIDITLQISNFHNHSGGVADSIRFGTDADLRAEDRKAFGYALIVCGSLLVMGIYHLLLYLIRPGERATLYFGLFCLLFCFWYLASGGSGRFLLDMIPLLNLHSLYRIDLLTFYLSVPAGVMYLHANFPDESIKTAARFFQISAAICGMVVLAAPDYIFVHTIIPYMVVAVLAIVYASSTLVRAIRRNRDGSVMVLCGFAVFAATVIHDILYANRLIQTGYIMHAGVLALVVSQSFVLASRFFKAFFTVESLSRDLADKNIALSRMDKVKDEFLANTSHELRTPLNGIIGLAESIRDGDSGKIPGAVRDNMGLIVESGRRLSGLISDILDFSRLKNRDVTLNRGPVDIRALTDVVLAVCRHLVGSRDIVLKNSIPQDFPFLFGDEGRLQQILYNLVGNAVKFTHSGEVNVTAALSGDMAEIRVTDTGIGIAAQYFDMIFKSFEQVDGTGSRHYGGAGLGLAITRHLVELHQGTVGVSSVLNEGTVFYFSIPVSNESPESGHGNAVPELLPQARANAPVPLMAVCGKRKEVAAAVRQVLVVDDDPVNLQVVSNHLAAVDNIRVLTRMNGPDALEWVNGTGCPDLILLDVMMPGMTGYEVCRTLREEYPASELPIIILTARGRMADIDEGFACGANDYLTKPFSKEELVARVGIQLHMKKTMDVLRANRKLEKEVQQERRKRETARLREEKARIEMLRYQLNPHFLFNALASIGGAIREDKAAARRMVSHLADFCRLALSRETVGVQTVNREIDMISHYVKMEEMRFEDSLKVSIDIEPRAGTVEIPALIVQPLIENAIKYGSLTSPDFLEVEIRAKISGDDMLNFKISNTGSWIKPGDIHKKRSTGIGIENIRNRLETVYSGNFSFETYEDSGRVNIEISVPVYIPAADNE